MLSLDANFNSALVNNSTNSSGERNYSNNSTFDRIYPALGFKYIINDRNRKWGLGPYYKLHLSQSLIVLKNIEILLMVLNKSNQTQETQMLLGGYLIKTMHGWMLMNK